MQRRASVALCLVTTLAAGAALAQADRPAPVMLPVGPAAMPGDYFDLPQSAQLKVPLGPPAGPNTRPPRPATAAPIPSPGMALAAAAAQAAEESCSADGYTVAVAVTDAAGNLKAALAPDGTRPNGVYMAMHKTAAVVGLKMSTLEFRAKAEKDPSLLSQIKPNMSLLPGGLPILKGDRIVGAIATSGATAYEEEKCAKAGIARIQSQLP